MSGFGVDQGASGTAGKPDTWWRTHGEAHPQARAAMWGAERSQGDMQLAIGEADVAGSGERLIEQGSPLKRVARRVTSYRPAGRSCRLLWLDWLKINPS
jgi:hypothetical protein